MEPTTHRLVWPSWATAAVLIWVAIVGATLIVERTLHQEIRLCMFHRLTWIPCPTCGSTRAAMAMLHGDLGAAIAYNPLVCALEAVLAALLLVRVVAARRIVADMSRWERRLGMSLLAIAVAANWVYVIIYVR